MTSAIPKEKISDIEKQLVRMLHHVDVLESNEGLYAPREPVYQEMLAIIKMLKVSGSAFKMQAFSRRIRKVATYVLRDPAASKNSSCHLRLLNIEMLGQACLNQYNDKLVKQIEQIAVNLTPILKRISLPASSYSKPKDLVRVNLGKEASAMQLAMEKEGEDLAVKLSAFYFSMACARERLEKDFRPTPWKAVECLITIKELAFWTITDLTRKKQIPKESCFEDDIDFFDSSMQHISSAVSPCFPLSPLMPPPDPKERKSNLDRSPMSSISFDFLSGGESLSGKLPENPFTKRINSELGGRY